MNNNRTSQSVDLLIEIWRENFPMPVQWPAIAKKYKFNEAKLHSLMFFLLSRSDADGLTPDECRNHAEQIKDVLSFDPISTPNE